MKYLFFALFSVSTLFCQSPKRILKKIGNNPIFYIDSVNVEKDELQKYDPENISSVTVYKDKEALELFGEDGKDGVIYIETKDFSKRRYWSFFQSKSEDYKKLLPSPLLDANVQYILNEKILEKDFEGTLATINNKVFKSITILSKEVLLKKYKIQDKDFGVLIISEAPDNLYRGNKKF